MTPDRAQWLCDNTTAFGNIPRNYRPGYYVGGNCAIHPQGMTREEDKELKELWNHMPGHTCFMDALRRIAQMQEVITK